MFFTYVAGHRMKYTKKMLFFLVLWECDVRFYRHMWYCTSTLLSRYPVPEAQKLERGFNTLFVGFTSLYHYTCYNIYQNTMKNKIWENEFTLESIFRFLIARTAASSNWFSRTIVSSIIMMLFSIHFVSSISLSNRDPLTEAAWDGGAVGGAVGGALASTEAWSEAYHKSKSWKSAVSMGENNFINMRQSLQTLSKLRSPESKSSKSSSLVVTFDKGKHFKIWTFASENLRTVKR